MFRLQGLTPTAGNDTCAAFVINDLGVAVGFNNNSGTVSFTMATKWNSAVQTAVGLAPGGLHSSAEGIDNPGRICGSADDGDFRPLGCVVENGGANIIDSGGNNSRTLSVSLTGQGVGGYAKGFGTPWLPVVWTENSHDPGCNDEAFLALFQDPSLLPWRGPRPGIGHQ